MGSSGSGREKSVVGRRLPWLGGTIVVVVVAAVVGAESYLESKIDAPFLQQVLNGALGPGEYVVGLGEVDVSLITGSVSIEGLTLSYQEREDGTPDGGPANRQVVTAQDGRDFVISSKREGYEFVKVYNHTPKEA